MTMAAGTITVNADATYSATANSMAKSIFEAWYPVVESTMTAATLATVADSTTGQTVSSKIRTSLAAQAVAFSTGIVAHITGFAHAHVTSESLGKTPNPNNANTAIVAPAAPVDIPIV